MFRKKVNMITSINEFLEITVIQRVKLLKYFSFTIIKIHSRDLHKKASEEMKILKELSLFH